LPVGYRSLLLQQRKMEIQLMPERFVGLGIHVKNGDWALHAPSSSKQYLSNILDTPSIAAMLPFIYKNCCSFESHRFFLFYTNLP
jgi:hypothetical protein